METAVVQLKDVRDVELTTGLTNALSGSLETCYSEYFRAAVSRKSTKEAERLIAAIPEQKRYLTRVLDSLDNAFADFETVSARLDLPHMKKCEPEAIKDYLQFRLIQLALLLEEVDKYVKENDPPPGGNS